MKYLLPLFFINVSQLAYAVPSPQTNFDPSWLVATRAIIKSRDYDLAIKQLKAVNQASSAEWSNLMGYAHRQKSPSDLLTAEKYYQIALMIDPKHKGALEYYGMLMLLNNDLAGAESHLLRLDKICFFGCEEYTHLREAIRKYKLNK
jgi:Flp pilus assembly protein TadD